MRTYYVASLADDVVRTVRASCSLSALREVGEHEALRSTRSAAERWLDRCELRSVAAPRCSRCGTQVGSGPTCPRGCDAPVDWCEEIFPRSEVAS